MKKIILGMAVLVALSLSAFATTEPINGAIIKQFKDNYPTASNVKWFQGKDYYQVSFSQTDIRSTMYFNNEDQVFRTLRYYNEDQLPPLILFTINEQYKNKDIKSVTELTETNKGISYEIVLEDSKNTIIVHSDQAGELNTVSKFKKTQ